MSVAVNVFNAGPEALTISLNSGSYFSIAATGPSLNWLPQQLSSGGPTFTGNNPLPNAFGYGQNQLLVNAYGSLDTHTILVTIPMTAEITALEMYIWFGTSNTVNWAAMNSGIGFAQGTSMPLVGPQ